MDFDICSAGPEESRRQQKLRKIEVTEKSILDFLLRPQRIFRIAIQRKGVSGGQEIKNLPQRYGGTENPIRFYALPDFVLRTTIADK